MKDRDKRILIILLIIGIALLPYFLYIKQTNVETESINSEIVRLENRLTELQAMNAHREEYIKKTEEYDNKMKAIIEQFPADVLPENYVMFLLGTELHTTKLDEETGDVIVEKPILFDSYEMTVNTETPIEAQDVSTNSATIGSLDIVETEYVAKTNISSLSFRTYYDGFKDIIQYLLDFEDPMIYRSLDVTYDAEYGTLMGKISLAQYAVSGPGRSLEKPEFTFQYKDIEEVFDYDLDDNNLRGNRKEDAKAGLFGPVKTAPVLDEEELQEFLEQQAANDSENPDGENPDAEADGGAEADADGGADADADATEE